MPEESRPPHEVPRSIQRRSPDRVEIWDRFVDELDRCGQAGSAADVLTPTTLDPDAPSGKRFGDLSRVEIDTLAKIGGSLGRRGDIVKTLWESTQQRIKRQKRAQKDAPQG
jgi:hypothetical protein